MEYNPKEIVKQILNNDFTLEQILSNNILCQTDIKVKFTRLTKFFIKEEVINKLIDYSLNYDSNLKDFEHLSHNSCELLSTIKHASFSEYFAMRQDDEVSGVSYPFIQRLFKYVAVNTEIGKASPGKFNKDNPLLDDLLSGYFKRIFLNLVSLQRKNVSIIYLIY